jgi:hypothetical protein
MACLAAPPRIRFARLPVLAPIDAPAGPREARGWHSVLLRRHRDPLVGRESCLFGRMPGQDHRRSERHRHHRGPRDHAARAQPLQVQPPCMGLAGSDPGTSILVQSHGARAQTSRQLLPGARVRRENDSPRGPVRVCSPIDRIRRADRRRRPHEYDRARLDREVEFAQARRLPARRAPKSTKSGFPHRPRRFSRIDDRAPGRRHACERRVPRRPDSADRQPPLRGSAEARRARRARTNTARGHRGAFGPGGPRILRASRRDVLRRLDADPAARPELDASTAGPQPPSAEAPGAQGGTCSREPFYEGRAHRDVSQHRVLRQPDLRNRCRGANLLRQALYGSLSGGRRDADSIPGRAVLEQSHCESGAGRQEPTGRTA